MGPTKSYAFHSLETDVKKSRQQPRVEKLRNLKQPYQRTVDVHERETGFRGSSYLTLLKVGAALVCEADEANTLFFFP